MKRCILPLTSVFVLLGAAANLRADVMISNLSQPGEPSVFGAGPLAGTIFSTGPARSRLNSVTLEHWYYSPAYPAPPVRIFQPHYTPGDLVPTMQFVCELGNPMVDPGGPQGEFTFVVYSPAAEISLEPSTSYAVIIGEALGGSHGILLLFASTSSYDAAGGWLLGDDLGGLDWGTSQQWWLSAGHLKFAVNASPEAQLNQPPDVSQSQASVATLWPPDGRMVPVAIDGVTDPDGDAVSISITGIQQDEPSELDQQGPDAVMDGAGTAAVRATRLGKGNGRVYKVLFTASDGKPGGVVNGAVYVSVPHDQAHPAIDDGPVSGYFNSANE